MSLLGLPGELLLLIADNLDGFRSINSFAKTNHQLYALLNDELYAKEASSGRGIAISFAARHGLQKTAELSLERGVRVDIVRLPQYCRGHTRYQDALHCLSPLQIAIAEGHESLACFLILRGADIMRIYSKPFPESRPLHIACARGLITTVKLLLEQGAKPSTRDKFGQTSLHYAVRTDDAFPMSKQRVHTVALLIKAGATHSIRDRKGRTPLELMIWNQRACIPRVRTDSHVGSVIRMMDDFSIDRCLPHRARRDQDSENDALQAERQVMALLEAKDAQSMVQRWEQDRKIQKHTIKVLEEMSRAKAVQDRKKQARQREKDNLVQASKTEATKLIEVAATKDAAATETTKQQSDLTHLAEIQRLERQTAAIASWSLLRQQAANSRQLQSTLTDGTGSRCTHSSVGWIRSKCKVSCELCNKMCRKYSYMSPDCTSSVCHVCQSKTGSV